MSEETFDFIVTGAGSAGCAVAARLSESGRYRVLLLEAGRRDSNPWIHIPLGYHKLYTHARYNWKFESEPSPASTAAPPTSRAARCWAAPARSTAWSTCAARRPTTTAGASAAARAGTTRACCPTSEGREPGARRERVPRRRRPAASVSDSRYRSEIIDAIVEAAVAGRHPAQRRLQRREPGRRRLLPDDRRQAAAAGAPRTPI